MSLKTLIAVSTMMGAFDNEMFGDINMLPKCKASRGHRIEVRTEPKIGRNEPCKCGSGLKYKKCGALGKCKNEA